MRQKTTSLKDAKKRKLFLMLPVLVLPFLTMLFWTMGGGSSENKVTGTPDGKGFNVALPVPKFKEDERLDKMSYYDKADTDSMRLLEEIKKDPNYAINGPDETIQTDWEQDFRPTGTSHSGNMQLYGSGEKDPSAQKIYEKLASLEKIVNAPPAYSDPQQDMREFDYHSGSEGSSQEMKSLEQMMDAMSAPQQPDPELKEIGGMLENILDIQHPERVKEKLLESAHKNKGKTYTVNRKIREENLTSLEVQEDANRRPLMQNSFFSIAEDSVAKEQANALEAVIHETTTLVNGSVAKLRLTNDVEINSIAIPKNSFLYGTVSLKGERLEIKISTIRYQNSILPVELAVYDMDGIPGIYIPGAINRESAKASADRSIQTLGLASLDDSWGAQAAGMGVEAAKSLLSKKVKLVKVVVKAGYKVLLYDEKPKSSN